MISADRPLVLGSASPRRRELLSRLRVPTRVLPANAAEAKEPEERPEAYLDRVVAHKLQAVAAQLDDEPFAGVLVADTTVVVDDEVLGKPASEADAVRLLSQLAGRTHRVYTRYAIARHTSPNRAAFSRTVLSEVTMRRADRDELRRYARTGEGSDKAGAYAIQGIGAFLVERIEGSFSNVVGLPVCEVVVDLQRAGLLESFP
jgi:septum formation protein